MDNIMFYSLSFAINKLGIKNGYSGWHYFLYSNKKYYSRNIYPDFLEKYIYRQNKSNNKIIKKEDMHYFYEYKEWWDKIKEIRKNEKEYKKSYKKYYGNMSEVTQMCINNNFVCENCINAEICEKYKTKFTQKDFAKLTLVLFKKNNRGSKKQNRITT